MTDSISVASFALSLLKTASEQLSKLRERAQATKDLEVKEQVGNLYDTINNLKEVFHRLSDENRELRQQLAAQQRPPEEPELRQVGLVNYYFKKGDSVPYCQPCWDEKRKLIPVSPPEQSESGRVLRRCRVCTNVFIEQRSTEQSQITPDGSFWSR